jgi:hypothetical protein
MIDVLLKCMQLLKWTKNSWLLGKLNNHFFLYCALACSTYLLHKSCNILRSTCVCMSYILFVFVNVYHMEIGTCMNICKYVGCLLFVIFSP